MKFSGFWSASRQDSPLVVDTSRAGTILPGMSGVCVMEYASSFYTHTLYEARSGTSIEGLAYIILTNETDLRLSVSAQGARCMGSGAVLRFLSMRKALHTRAETFPDALLVEVAERFGTPTYLYRLDTVDAQLRALSEALPEAHLHYAVKANPCGAVLRHLSERGLGAEVITLGELERALHAGFPPERLILGGPGQSNALVARAAEVGVGAVSLDSLSTAALWKGFPQGMLVMPRVNPGLDPRTHEHLATGAATSKFGMTPEEAFVLAERLGERLAGFHVHAGSQIGDLSVYDEIFSVLTPLFERFSEATTLDLGGGFAVPGFPLEGFAARVRSFVEGLGLRLLLEPGRFLVAPAGVLLTRVLHVKEGATKHVIADAGMADLLRPALYGAAHPIRRVGERGTLEMVDVDGPLCENADRLGRGVALEASPGDLLAVEGVGAYGLTMASNYASSLRPAEVTVQGGRVSLARRRENVADLLRLEHA